MKIYPQMRGLIERDDITNCADCKAKVTIDSSSYFNNRYINTNQTRRHKWLEHALRVYKIGRRYWGTVSALKLKTFTSQV